MDAPQGILRPGYALLGRLPLAAKLALLGSLFAVAGLGAAGALVLPAWRAPAVGGAVAFGIAWAYLALCFCLGFERGLRRVQGVLAQIEAGQLAGLPQPRGRDEIARIESSLAGLAAQLSTLVAGMRTSSVLVAHAGEALARDCRDLAQRTEQQAAGVQQTSASVKQLLATVQGNAQAAAGAEAQAGEVEHAARDGARSMDAAVGAVTRIEAESQRIRDAVAVIDDIAFQTNILALNAAVEAARAGDQGRGFAVVAGEVRRLAQRCADESQRIRVLINASAEHVSAGVSGIREAGSGMTQLAAGVQLVAREMSGISQASAQQGTALAEIASAMTHLDGITQRNGAIVEQAANQARYLKDRAADLSGSVDHFRLQQGTAAEAIELVRRARTAFEGCGRADFLAHINASSGQYHDRDMYVFAFDLTGRYLACAGMPAKVGTRVHDIPGVRGDALLGAIVKQADEGPGWVEYEITNPATGRVEPKMSFVTRLGDLYVGCGVYRTLIGLAA